MVVFLRDAKQNDTRAPDGGKEPSCVPKEVEYRASPVCEALALTQFEFEGEGFSLSGNQTGKHAHQTPYKPENRPHPVQDRADSRTHKQIIPSRLGKTRLPALRMFQNRTFSLTRTRAGNEGARRVNQTRRDPAAQTKPNLRRYQWPVTGDFVPCTPTIRPCFLRCYTACSALRAFALCYQSTRNPWRRFLRLIAAGHLLFLGRYYPQSRIPRAS